MISAKKQRKRIEREIYAQLYAEFQRKARRNKKIFLKEQCKEVEENNRMGKTRNLLKKMELSKENLMHNGHDKG